ncbi:MAG: recombination mediator RecR [Christensenellales bacterium]|jgi:recombination protein RecR|nr:recombination mediator RecR [Eubacteriales bacterium]MCI6028448.1 recombination mediator RecR [Clostridiales bacterium]MDD7415080.1 recombination mediator RecR [Clostridiales bacterium]MDY5732492.1 recombination mediator RecR [Eubacteriales bacterium]
MNRGIEPIETLCSQLARLPGIGSKSALRLAYHILDMPKSSAKELAAAISNACDKVHHCSICGNYTDVDPCRVCTDKTRSDDTICVVEDAKDVLAMEKMREFRGKYHVLGGVISPMDGIGPDDIRIKELIARVRQGGVKEIIIATNPNIEGEATSSYIARLLKPLGVRVTRIAHGIPIGGNIEYADEMTILKAMEGRREL